MGAGSIPPVALLIAAALGGDRMPCSEVDGILLAKLSRGRKYFCAGVRLNCLIYRGVFAKLPRRIPTRLPVASPYYLY
jgi:hypothetical protein